MKKVVIVKIKNNFGIFFFKQKLGNQQSFKERNIDVENEVLIYKR